MSTIETLDWGPIMAPDAACAPLVKTGLTRAQVAQCGAGLVLLATPYRREVIKAGRWDYARSVEASLMAARELHLLAQLKVTALCPSLDQAEICHSGIAVQGRKLDPLDYEFWQGRAEMLARCASAVLVPDLQGWQRSDGIMRTVTGAISRNVPVAFYTVGGAR